MKTIVYLFIFFLGVQHLHAQEPEIVNLEGHVTDQDGNAVSGANVCVYRPNFQTGVNEVEYYGTTDMDGHYVVSVEKNSNPYYSYNMSVKAENYPDYVATTYFTLDGSFYSFFQKEVVLWNRLDYIKNQQATIILPEAPDPSFGRYYRYDHLEGAGGLSVVFKREEEPKANVPYIIFPNEDFSIDLKQYTHISLPEPGYVLLVPEDSIRGYGFYGTYVGTDGDGHFLVIDSTPDCWDGKAPNPPRVGPFRAYLRAARSSSIVFDDGQTGILSNSKSKDSIGKSLYDLQGRPTNKHANGIYIQNRKKVLVKPGEEPCDE